MEVTLNATAGMQASSTARQEFGAQVVSKTLEYMNNSQTGVNSSADYDFQTSVLGAAYEGSLTGAIINEMV